MTAIPKRAFPAARSSGLARSVGSLIARTLCALLICVNLNACATPEGTLRIYLARHGETDWNAERRLQGWIDTSLNQDGRQQAALLGERLKGIRLNALYSSTLARSRQTAEIAAAQVPLFVLADLRERNLGKFQGLREDDPVVGPEYVKRSRDPDDELDGGESLNQFFARVKGAVERIRRENASGTVLIVGHGITNRMVLRALLNLTFDQAMSIQQANDELYVVEINPGTGTKLWKLITDTNLDDL